MLTQCDSVSAVPWISSLVSIFSLEILEELTKSLNEPASENTQSDFSEIDSFCQYISKSLNKFDEKTKNIVKNGIQNLIFQAEMGNAITPMLGQ